MLRCQLPPQGLEDHPYNQQAFVEGWARLWKMAACLPNFSQDLANRIFVDVMNEPDSMGIKWEPSGSRPGAHQLYLGTADALWALTPGAVLFWFEGAHAVQPTHAPLGALRNYAGGADSWVLPPARPRGPPVPAGLATASPAHLRAPHAACPRNRPEQLWPQLGQRLHHRQRRDQCVQPVRPARVL